MHSLNLGILAHVDAGKTSLTERLLYAAGAIHELGSVEQGNTQTDTLALERRRKITIRSAVASFVVNDVSINLTDTPGHPDFIAEVERVLNVLDGAVLIVSAVEGVQAQTIVLARALKRLSIPTLIFVNKIDRRGSNVERAIRAISARLTPDLIPVGSVSAEGTSTADFSLVRSLDDELVNWSQQGSIHAVYCGSAITGAGVDLLMDGITTLLPTASGSSEGPESGLVFKVDRGARNEKIAYVRMYSGSLKVRTLVTVGEGIEQKITSIQVFANGAARTRDSVVAGQIAMLFGLTGVRIGDSIGSVLPCRSPDNHFPPPTMETVIVPIHRHEKGDLYTALAQLAEQDPLINLRRDDLRQEIYVSLYGEVQKDVVRDTLAADFGIEVEFRETTPICIERPSGSGSALEVLGQTGNPFLATLGLRIEPGPLDSGIQVNLQVKAKSIPVYVYKSVQEFEVALSDLFRHTLLQGLYGWNVTDCAITVTDCGYSSPGTTSGDFTRVSPLVLMAALKRAGTVVCEPLHSFRLEAPTDSLAPVTALLSRLLASIQDSNVSSTFVILTGEIHATQIHELQRQLPALSSGEGVLETSFSRYAAVRSGNYPTRPRTDDNPLNRSEYLMRLSGRRPTPRTEAST